MSDPAHTHEERIFLEALAQPEGDRAAFLEQACAGDAMLLAGVKALLAVHERPEAFIDKSPVAPPELAVEEKAGDRIGRYKLLQQIGEGGCGVVYMAEQMEPVHRRVAVKVIKLGMDTKAVIARFDAERQALAMMDHPNIARVLDAGATESGRPFFVMELVRGQPITRFCDEDNLSTTARIQLFIQVCRAIQHAHQKGIIHRDIKPSNIIVALHDTVAVPKVIDFGIAKATQGRLTDQTVFTAFEQFVGTPAYTSPEQANLSGLDIDTRSDIYSLGVLLYELLTGRTPFDAKDLAKAGLDEVRRQIREVEPPRPSTRLSTMEGDALDTAARQRQTAAPKLINLVRGDLDWIVMRCLEKDRRRRYETANDLAVDLERHLDNEPVMARPPSAGYRLGKILRRHKLACSTAAAVAAALMVGLSIATWSLVLERAARERANAAEQKAVSEAKKSEQVAQFLQAMLQGIGPSVALGRDTTLLREIVDQTAVRLEQDLKDQPAVGAELRHTLGQVYFELGEYEKAKSMHQGALNRRTKLFGGEHPDVAKSLVSLALVRNAQGDAAGAEAMLRHALAMQRSLVGSQNLEVASTLTELASVLFSKRDPVAAEVEQRTALQIQQKAAGGPSPSFAQSLTDLALSVEARGDLVAAENLAREALSMQRRFRGNDHPDVARALYALGSILYSRKDGPEAEKAIREALIMRERLFGKEHPLVAQAGYLLAAVMQMQQSYDAANAIIRDVIAVQRKTLGIEHPRVAQSLRLLAAILGDRRERASASEAALEALRIQRKAFGAEHLEVADTLSLLARILAFHRDSNAAEEVGREALAMRRRLADPTLLRGLWDMMWFLNFRGKSTEAVVIAQEMIGLLCARVGPEDRLTLEAMADLAWTFYYAGEYRSGRAVAEAAIQKFTVRLGPTALETLGAKRALGAILTAEGAFTAAIALYEEVIDELRLSFGAAHDMTIRTRYALAFVYRRAGHLKIMQSILEEDLGLVRARYSEGSTGLSHPLIGLGEAFLLQQKYTEAEPLLREAFRGLERNADHSWIFFRVQSLLGRALAGQGRYPEAESLLLEAHENLLLRRDEIAIPSRHRLRESADAIVQLYTQWGKLERAAVWQMELKKLQVTVSGTTVAPSADHPR